MSEVQGGDGELAERCTPVYARTPKGQSGSDKVADGAVEMADYFTEREAVANAYLRHVGIVEREIDKLEDSEERRVLRYWYVDGMTPGEIMMLMHMSRGTVYNRRSSALEKMGIKESLDTFGLGNGL